MMVHDIAAGAQVGWLNPHLALYNEEDQRIDLRPLRNHFVQVFDYGEIAAVLQRVYQLVLERLPRYRDNQPVGHTIVLYLDEWPSIARQQPGCLAALQGILCEGRKCRVFVVLASQDGTVETLGLKSGARDLFKTRLLGNVDAATWTALMGKGIPRTRIEQGRGIWRLAPQRGESAPTTIQITRPTATEIARISAQPAGCWPSLLERQAAPPLVVVEQPPVEQPPVEPAITDDHRRALAMIESNPYLRHSKRQLAIQLWPECDGSGSWNRKAGELITDLETASLLEPLR